MEWEQKEKHTKIRDLGTLFHGRLKRSQQGHPCAGDIRDSISQAREGLSPSALHWDSFTLNIGAGLGATVWRRH